MNVVHWLRDYMHREGAMWCGESGDYAGKDGDYFGFRRAGMRHSDMLASTALAEVTCEKCRAAAARLAKARRTA